MNPDYSNREIDRMFLEIQDALARIEGQTTKTNGRVSKLELWQSLVIGGLSVITIIVLPLLGYLFSQIIHVSARQDQMAAIIQPK